MTPYKRRVSYHSGLRHGQTAPAQKQVLIIWEPAAQAYKCTFPYNKAFIEILKGIIPSSDRDYKPETHTWYILEKYYDLFLAGAKANYANASFVCTTREEYEKNAASFNQNAGANTSVVYSQEETLAKFGALLKEANVQSFTTVPTLADITKAYKKAAFVLHPDRNPANANKMSELNEVYTRLKGALK